MEERDDIIGLLRAVSGRMRATRVLHEAGFALCVVLFALAAFELVRMPLAGVLTDFYWHVLLAGLAIFLSHFYWVHLNRDVYPMSMVWLSGEMSEHEMRLRHPAELEQIKIRQAQEQETEQQESVQEKQTARKVEEDQ